MTRRHHEPPIGMYLDQEGATWTHQPEGWLYIANPQRQLSPSSRLLGWSKARRLGPFVRVGVDWRFLTDEDPETGKRIAEPKQILSTDWDQASVPTFWHVYCASCLWTDEKNRRKLNTALIEAHRHNIVEHRADSAILQATETARYGHKERHAHD